MSRLSGSLDRYGIPHDPDSVHQLHWEPGQYGKGLLSDDGTVHTWNTGRQDGEPGHRRYVMEAMGWDPYQNGVFRTGSDPNKYFWIDPKGHLEPLEGFGPEHLKQVQAVDPRIGPPQGGWSDWRFADAQAQERVLHGGGPPRHVGNEPDASPEAITNDPRGFAARRPFIYDGASNTVYNGAPGQHHNAVRQQYGLSTNHSQFEGYVMKGLQNHPIQGDEPDYAEWVHDAPANHEEVLNSVAERHQVTPVHYEAPEEREWKFGASDPTQEILDMLAPTPNKSAPTVDPERAADPVGYERRHDWDRPGDVQHGHPDIEWVPTHELKKFMEYDRRPGGKDSWNNPERWDALGKHILEHGFKNPIWIDYNPDTGHAHMSEGNHRTQLALDLGIPALPVRVYRSSRSSQTAVPVKASPEPEWEDRYDPTGYHWPEYMRPTHIGLPTVPAPGTEHTSAAQYMYHVAPASARERILAEGLRGHEIGQDESVVSPWTQEVGQPHGNYLYENPYSARTYAVGSSQRTSPVKHVYPGDLPWETYSEHGIHPQIGEAEGWVLPQPPPESADWDDEAWEHWYDNEEDNAVPFDHENPEHMALLPDNLKGHDIWRVNVSGLPLSTDPEEYLVGKNNKYWDYKPPQGPESLDKYDDEEEWPDLDSEPRWMTPEHVHPSRLEHYEHIPAWQVNDQYANDTLDEAGEHQIPSDLMLIHPRHILPKGKLPPELREIWSKRLAAKHAWTFV